MSALQEFGERRPLATGAIEGAGIACAATFADAMLPGFAGTAWGLLLWSAVAFGRSPGRQATAVAVLGLATDALSGSELGRSVVPLAAAMLAGGIVRPTRTERGSVDHAAFAGVALAAWMVARTTLAWAMPSVFGPMPPAGGMLMSVPVLGAVCAIVALVRVVRGIREPDKRVRAIRFGGRLA